MSISAATTTGLVFRNKFMNNSFPGICTTNSFFACFARRAAIVEKLVFAPNDDRSPLLRAETENEIRGGKRERVKNFIRCADMH